MANRGLPQTNCSDSTIQIRFLLLSLSEKQSSPTLLHCCLSSSAPFTNTDASCPRLYPVHPRTDTSAEVFPLHHTCTHTLRTELRLRNTHTRVNPTESLPKGIQNPFQRVFRFKGFTLLHGHFSILF